MTGTFAGQAGHQTSIHRLNDSIALSHGPAEFAVDAGRRLRAKARCPMPVMDRIAPTDASVECRPRSKQRPSDRGV